MIVLLTLCLWREDFLILGERCCIWLWHFCSFWEPEGSTVLGGFFPAVSALLLADPYEEHDVAISCKKKCFTFQTLLHSNHFYFYWKLMSVIMEPDSPFLSRDQRLATKERTLILLKWKKSNNPLFWSHCSLSINYLVAWHLRLCELLSSWVLSFWDWSASSFSLSKWDRLFFYLCPYGQICFIFKQHCLLF